MTKPAATPTFKKWNPETRKNEAIEITVGMGVTESCGSDAYPYEVIEIRTANKIVSEGPPVTLTKIRLKVTRKEAEEANFHIVFLPEVAEEWLEHGEITELPTEYPEVKDGVLTIPLSEGGETFENCGIGEDFIDRIKHSDAKASEELYRKIQYALGGRCAEYQRELDHGGWITTFRGTRYVKPKPEPDWRVG